MKIFFWVLCIFIFVFNFSIVPALAGEKTDQKKSALKKEVHKYVKSKKCKMCHKIEYKSWKKTKHAAALENLKELKADEIKELGEKVGMKDAKIDDCIQCHVTGYDEKKKSFSEGGVSCEACHGPGKDFSKMTIMKKVEKAKKMGLIIPTDSSSCVVCHNKKSPKYKKFDFDSARGKVHDFKKKPKWAE